MREWYVLMPSSFGDFQILQSCYLRPESAGLASPRETRLRPGDLYQHCSEVLAGRKQASNWVVEEVLLEVAS